MICEAFVESGEGFDAWLSEWKLGAKRGVSLDPHGRKAEETVRMFLFVNLLRQVPDRPCDLPFPHGCVCMPRFRAGAGRLNKASSIYIYMHSVYIRAYRSLTCAEYSVCLTIFGRPYWNPAPTVNMSNSDEMSVKQEAEQRSPSPDPIPTKQSRLAFLYRKTSMWLLIFYVPLLLIPWILTCVLSGHPGDSQDTARQYLPQSGLMPNGVLSILSWVAAIRTLGSIAGVATIPVMSALLGQAAVVYTQRRKQGQELSMRQTFTLADRRWSDITVLYDAFKNRGSARPASRFLWLAMALILLSKFPHVRSCSLKMLSLSRIDQLQALLNIQSRISW